MARRKVHSGGGFDGQHGDPGSAVSARFADARVRAFLPILVERAVRRELQP
ncbi:MAG TPA: hypothetical protein VGM60_01625 [Pseudonocardia sp.]|jgi:hypothetical protein|uniref:three-helix bundle dimerization domain-containing protein n=1 Tax=Pseudonocardia sp. TaxID=60912 RepID=UPI002F3ED7E0